MEANMRLGVLDVGSNSAQLQVVDAYAGAPPLPTQAVKEPTLLGEAYDEDGSIEAAGVQRVVTAVERAVDTAQRMKVEQLFVFATSAIRDAANNVAVADEIERAAGIRPRFLSGEDEARLTYLAVRRWYGWSAGRILVLDIGGGSMELALGRDAQPEVAVSLPLGAGRLTRAFLPDHPPSRAQLHLLRRYVRSTLREVSDRLRWEGDPKRVVATSKTFKQLARLAGAAPQRRGPFVRRPLRKRDLAHWISELSTMPTRERAKLRGVSESRALQILAGAIVAKSTMDALDVRRVDVSPWALREGIMLHHLETVMGEVRSPAIDAAEPVTRRIPPATRDNVTTIPRPPMNAG
jgi:exopolyphosphatase/guanosine-5'-triphosphate,3'-diphosphate pyrophosphatase